MQRVLHDVGQRAREQRAVDQGRRQVRRRLDVEGHTGPGPVGLHDLIEQCREIGRLWPRGGRRRKARELARDLAQQLHLRQDGGDALVEHRRQRPAAIDVDALGVLGGQLDWRERVLDVVRHLPRHLGPRLEALRPLEVGALRLQIVGHPVEVFHQAAQFIRRGGGDTRVEVAARDAPGGAGEAVHRVGDAFSHPVAEGRAEQHEQHGGRQHAPVDLVDLLLDLALPQRLRHGHDPFARTGADRRRGHQVSRRSAECLHDHGGRQPVEHNRSIDVGRRASGKQA